MRLGRVFRWGQPEHEAGKRLLGHTVRSMNALSAQRELVSAMVARDFRNQYRGSHLGLFWAVLHPASTLALFWFVFEVGFGAASPRNGYPYVIWLAAGMLPWFYFSSALMGAGNVLHEYAFLVRKTSFRLSLLPVVKLLSALSIHLVSIGLLLVLTCLLSSRASWTMLQIPYYIVCNFMLLLGLSWITASVAVFVRDVGHIVSVLLQFGMWVTPIMWSPAMIPAPYRLLIKLNPVYYLTEGFRECFMGQTWFWERPVWTLYFWTVTVALLALGAFVFRRLRPHFGDMV